MFSKKKKDCKFYKNERKQIMVFLEQELLIYNRKSVQFKWSIKESTNISDIKTIHDIHGILKGCIFSNKINSSAYVIDEHNKKYIVTETVSEFPYFTVGGTPIIKPIDDFSTELEHTYIGLTHNGCLKLDNDINYINSNEYRYMKDNNLTREDVIRTLSSLIDSEEYNCLDATVIHKISGCTYNIIISRITHKGEKFVMKNKRFI